jgi:hypothetical protein
MTETMTRPTGAMATELRARFRAASEVGSIAPASVRIAAKLALGTADRAAGPGVRAAAAARAGLALGAAGRAADPGIRAAGVCDAGLAVRVAAVEIAGRRSVRARKAAIGRTHPPVSAAVGAAVDFDAEALPVLVADLA